VRFLFLILLHTHPRARAHDHISLFPFSLSLLPSTLLTLLHQPIQLDMTKVRTERGTFMMNTQQRAEDPRVGCAVVVLVVRFSCCGRGVLFSLWQFRVGEQESVVSFHHWSIAKESQPGTSLVLLHDVGLHSGLFQWIVAELTERFHVWGVDLPGHGQSYGTLHEQLWRVLRTTRAAPCTSALSWPIHLPPCSQTRYLFCFGGGGGGGCCCGCPFFLRPFCSRPLRGVGERGDIAQFSVFTDVTVQFLELIRKQMMFQLENPRDPQRIVLVGHGLGCLVSVFAFRCVVCE
jgi:pimeloyl-ACP methyl ester carboxylesterase